LECHLDPARKLSANLYDMYHCCVYSEKTPDVGQRNCPKRVEFHSKKKFEELLHLVGLLLQEFLCHIQKSSKPPQLLDVWGKPILPTHIKMTSSLNS